MKPVLVTLLFFAAAACQQRSAPKVDSKPAAKNAPSKSFAEVMAPVHALALPFSLTSGKALPISPTRDSMGAANYLGLRSGTPAMLGKWVAKGYTVLLYVGDTSQLHHPVEAVLLGTFDAQGKKLAEVVFFDETELAGPGPALKLKSTLLHHTKPHHLTATLWRMDARRTTRLDYEVDAKGEIREVTHGRVGGLVVPKKDSLATSLPTKAVNVRF